MTLSEMQTRLQELEERSRSLARAVESEQRSFTAEEAVEVDAALEEMDELRSQISRMERLQQATAGNAQSAGRRTEPAAPGGGAGDGGAEARGRTPVRVIGDRAARDPSGGFRSFAEFARSVAHACQGGDVDRRLLRMQHEDRTDLTDFGSSGTPADGGYALPPDFREPIIMLLTGEDAGDRLAPLCDIWPTSRSEISVPMDQHAPWDPSGGIKAFWVAEGDPATQSKPKLTDNSNKPHRIAALVPVTDQLLEDAPALDRYLRTKSPEAVAWEVDLAILHGDGSGKPLGVLHGDNDALITVDRESGQDADSIVAANLLQMWTRMPARRRRNASWVIHQDHESALQQMFLEGEAGGIFPLMLPPGGLSQSPYQTILGRPVIFHEAAEEAGEIGECSLIDFRAYWIALRSGQTADTSIHLWFDRFVTAFRFSLRIGGKPWWKDVVPSAHGDTTRSPYVTLGAPAGGGGGG